MTRTAIIVLGMHRTGTSAISGVMAHLGATAPRSLMPPTPDNPKGYWESTAVMRFNDRVLESAGTRWSDWDKFNEEWVDSPLRDAFAGELSTIFEEEFGDSPLILIKDPRICRIFPFWASSLRDAGIEPKVIIPLRHPSEVVGSLVARDRLAESQAKLIWLRHMLDAEYGSRGLARVFVRYSDMLRDWHGQVRRISERLGVKWPRKSATTIAEIDAYLTPELRHHVAEPARPPEDGGIDGWVFTAHEAIGSLADGGDEGEALRVLDGIRRDFDRTSAIYGPVVHEQRSQLEREISGLDAGKAMLSGELEAIRAAHESLKIENVTNFRLYDDTRKRLEAMQERERNQGAATVAMISQHEITVAELSTKLDHVGWERAELVSKLDHSGLKRTELAQLLERTEQENADLAARLDHSGSERVELARLLEQAEQGRTDLAARLERIEQVRSELASGFEHAERERNGLEARLEACRRERMEITSRLERTAEERDAFASRLEVAEGGLAAMESAVASAKREHAVLDSRHRDRLADVATRLNAEIARLEDSLFVAEESLQEQADESARLTQWVLDLQHDLELRQAECEALAAQGRGDREAISRLDRRIRGLEAGKRAMAHEIGAQAALLSGHHAAMERLHSSRYWKISGKMGLFGKDAVADAGEEDMDALDDASLLRRSGLFDREWYLERYPDVRARKMDPVRHYLKYGAREGRDPNPAFSTRSYLALYPDVASAGVNPLAHYIRHGRREGRGISARTGG